MKNKESLKQWWNTLFDHSISLEEYLDFSLVQDVNMRVQGKTPLHEAVSRNDLGLFKELLKHPEIEVNVLDADGATPFRYSLRQQRQKMFDLFLQHPQLDPDADALPIPMAEKGGLPEDEPHFYREQLAELDLGRRGTLAMVEKWRQVKGEFSVRGGMDLANASNWGKPKGNDFSILDLAIIHNNQPVLKYLVRTTDLLPQLSTLTYPLKPEWHEADRQQGHPANALIEAMENETYAKQWREVKKEETMDPAEVASMIKAWLTKTQMERKFPDQLQSPTQKAGSRL